VHDLSAVNPFSSGFLLLFHKYHLLKGIHAYACFAFVALDLQFD
jgi:hypothetical protein